jgi:hypothetical protein
MNAGRCYKVCIARLCSMKLSAPQYFNANVSPQGQDTANFIHNHIAMIVSQTMSMNHNQSKAVAGTFKFVSVVRVLCC